MIRPKIQKSIQKNNVLTPKGILELNFRIKIVFM